MFKKCAKYLKKKSKISLFSEFLISYFQAPREIAPILACAPHATIIDAIAILLSGSVPVAKKQLWYSSCANPVGK